MTAPRAGRRRFAMWLIASCRRAARPERREWVDAMSHELSAIPSDDEALRWALGCVLATCLSSVRRQLQRPSAFMPLAMSAAALMLVIGHAAIFGVQAAADEGTPAHIFQLLMVAQLPIVGFSAIRWLPEDPLAACEVLVLHGGAGALAIASVLFLT